MDTTLLFEGYLTTIAIGLQTIYVKMIDTKSYKCYECNITKDHPQFTFTPVLCNLDLFYIIENSFNKHPGTIINNVIDNNIMKLLFIGLLRDKVYKLEISIIQNISYTIESMFLEIQTYNSNATQKILNEINKHLDLLVCDSHSEYFGTNIPTNPNKPTNTKKIKIE